MLRGSCDESSNGLLASGSHCGRMLFNSVGPWGAHDSHLLWSGQFGLVVHAQSVLPGGRGCSILLQPSYQLCKDQFLVLNHFLLNTNGMTFLFPTWTVLLCPCLKPASLFYIPCLLYPGNVCHLQSAASPICGVLLHSLWQLTCVRTNIWSQNSSRRGSGWRWDPGYCCFFSKQFLSHIAPNNYNSSYTCAQSQRPSNHHVLESERSFKPQGLSCPENWSPKLPNTLDPINKATEKQSAVISFVEGHALSKIFREGKEVEALRVLLL